MEISYFERATYREPFAFWYFKKRIDSVLNNLDDMTSIDDIIEVYNIKIFIDNIEKIDSIPDNDKSNYYKYRLVLNRKIGIYFSKVTTENFDEYAKNVDPNYARDFWEIMCSFKRIDTITKEKFQNYLRENPHHADDVLTQNELVLKFSEVLFQHFLEHPDSVKIIISSLFENKRTPEPTLYIREKFTSEQLKTLYAAYINSDHPNINMLKLLMISQNDPLIGLDDNVRLSARHKYQALCDELSGSPYAICNNSKIAVSFRDTDKLHELVKETDNTIMVFSRKWIRENTDYLILLNNFIYMFGYTDSHLRSVFPFNKRKVSTIEDIFTIKGKNTYRNSAVFSTMSGYYSLIMKGYLVELQILNIDIEEIFKWFFEEYLPNEFYVTNFSYFASSAGTTYLEKCKNIATEMERVLKLYRQYSKHGHIDLELFEMSSEHLIYADLLSMQEKKYIYPKSERVERCINDLFCDVMLCYTEDGSLKGYDNFYEALINLHRIDKKLLLREYQLDALKRLLNFGAIREDAGYYVLDNVKSKILYHFYDKQVLCYHHCKHAQKDIDEMIKNNDVEVGNTLFSKPECEYMNYILNKSSYSDGLNLRNKYCHGSISTNEDIHYSNYLEFLKIMVLVIIKIHEEFCLKNTDNNS